MKLICISYLVWDEDNLLLQYSLKKKTKTKKNRVMKPCSVFVIQIFIVYSEIGTTDEQEETCL